MKKLLLFVAVVLGSVAMSNAQQTITSFGIIGDATPGGWGADTEMTTTDNENYVLNDVDLVAGGLKFRTNGDWAVNYGGSSLSGTGVAGGDNIPVIVAGKYNITFNVVTFEYAIVPPAGADSVVQLKGASVGAGTYVLSSTDGENYTGLLTLVAGDLWFDLDGANQGGADFASGTVTSGDAAAAIVVPADGGYTVTYVKSTGAYTFEAGSVTEFVQIGLIGDSTAGGWDTDTFLTTTDGINYTVSGVALLAGKLKFRQAAAWTYAWGGAIELPLAAATADVGGADMTLDADSASTFDITFNRFTGAFTFTDTINLGVADLGVDVVDVVAFENPSVDGAIALSQVSDVTLYSLAGQVVANQSNTSSVDVSGIVPGVYVIVINGAQVGKVVVK